MPDTPDLSGQVALVTGGGRGLGRAYGQALAAAGALVALASRDEVELAAAEHAILEAGGRAFGVPTDVTDETAVERLVVGVEAAYGPIDLLVNNAGVVGPTGPSWEVDPQVWWRSLEINVLGCFVCACAVIPSMLERGAGRIVNVSSGAVDRAGPRSSAYATSKTALTHWTEDLARELDGTGIVAFAYDPGFHRTAMTEHLAEGDDVDPSLRARFHDRLARGLDRPFEEAVVGLMILASGLADGLSGMLLRADDDLKALAARGVELRGRDAYVLRRSE